MRTLYYVPIVHQMRESALHGEMLRRKARPEEFEGLNRFDHDIELGWGRFMRMLGRLRSRGLSIPSLRLYSDGTLQRPNDEPMVPEWDQKEKSPNVAVLLYLCSKGALLYGTEHPTAFGMMVVYMRLLLEDALPTHQLRQLKNHIVRLRDLHIARYICSNLPDGGTGMLFIGARHDVDTYIRRYSPDIEIRYLTTFAKLHPDRYGSPARR